VHIANFALGRLQQPRQDKILLYRHNEPNKPTRKEGPFSFVLLESPFTSASTVSRGHHSSLVSLGARKRWLSEYRKIDPSFPFGSKRNINAPKTRQMALKMGKLP
jgi:hypothetical protein